MLNLHLQSEGDGRMRDLREDLDPIWRAVTRVQPGLPGARAIMFVAAQNGEGTTSMAASFACIAARRAENPTWMVDLDLKRNPAIAGFEKGFARDVGAPGRAYDASLRQDPPYYVAPANPDDRSGKLLTAHDIDGLPLLVTRFRNERMSPDHRVKLQAAPDWWAALRKISGFVIVDAPALERSSAALTMADQVDGIVLVVEADRTNAEHVASAKHELEAQNGRVLGVVMNRVGADARFADRFAA